MTIRLNPYLNFRDQSRAALEFYHSVLGGELTIATFGDYGMSDDPDRADLVMHGHLVSDAGLDIMASDTPPGGDDPAMGTAINIALTGDDERLRDYFTGLSGTIIHRSYNSKLLNCTDECLICHLPA